ncbi:MAG: PAS domain-containing protein [Verrucomicrobiota bacterium]
MKQNPDQPANAAELRGRAEERLKGQKTEDGGQRTELETARLVHELQVHQIELEMQNDELHQAHAKAEALLAQYTGLYDFAPTGYLTLDREGTIRQLNLTGARLLGLERSRLVNRRFGQFVAEGDRGLFRHFLEQVFASEAKAGCEVTLPQVGHPPRFVQIEGTRSADGQECLAVVQDHTERRQAQELAQAAQAETQRLLALSDQSRRALFSAAEDERETMTALRESEKSLKEAQRIARLGSYVLNIPSGLWTSSELLDTIFGIDAAYDRSVAGWAALIHPEDRTMMGDYFRNEVLAQGQPFDKEYRIVRHDDQAERWVHGYGKLEFDAEGHPLKMHGTIQDVTERRQAQAELDRMRNLLREGQRIAHLGSWEYIADKQETLWSEEQLRIYGLNPAGPSPDYQVMLRHHIHPDDAAQLDETFRQCLQDRAVFELEHRIVRPDGSVRVLQELARPFLDDHGRLVKYVGATLDITERKRAEAALRETEAQFRTMADSMSQLAWIAKADGFIFWYNRRWHDFTGTTPEQMEGWGWQRVLDPEALTKVLESWKGAIATGRPFEMEFPIRGADGRFRNFLTRVQPLKDSEGHVVQWFGTNTDVDELKRAEEEVRRLNAELDQRIKNRTVQLETANKELEAFSYSVSHDLRVPLRAIDGFARILDEEYAARLDGEGRRLLGVVCGEAKRMGQLIDDLLAFSKMSRQPAESAPIDLTALARAVFAECAAQAPGRQLEFKVQPLPPAQGDHAMLHQVLQNLCSNAIKYTRPRAVAQIEIGGRPEGEKNLYYVKDNGVGFDMQYAGKLFGVFQRLHADDKFEGTGVGLALVQRVIHRHGGRVWAEAKLNEGATFYFTLPNRQPDADKETPSPTL